ncbi:MAG: TylF/MycF/NovP-related O-methyltransferase [Undibacterium sp.]|nr:TylF/MycF/NovP-related O-methyltransferase [Undibacterium sp.]
MLALRNAIVPNMGPHWNLHSNLFVKRITLSRILYFNHLYSLIREIPGVICEFGVQWGASLALLANLRAMYEPYNYSRKIIGFDTFSGFEAPHEKDGGVVAQGDYASMDAYAEQLEEILGLHESLSPISHIKKFELVKGDASTTIVDWLAHNPYAVISMAIFDMDVYQPTKDVLEQILPRLVKGSVLVFDELSCQRFPGETLALAEVIGLNNLKLRRDPNQPFCSWAVWD